VTDAPSHGKLYNDEDDDDYPNDNLSEEIE
jgi:hypothetical protein